MVGRWDPIRLEEAIGNLVDNAIKFGAPKPVAIDVHRENGWAVVSVHDDGPGISKEDQKQVFARYRRLRSAEGHGGLGLGLYVVKSVAEAHGGTVHVDSRVGEGSTFVLKLPMSSQP